MITSALILNLLLILTAAWVLGAVFNRFGLPFMIGELLAGILLGPPLLGIVGASGPIEMLAELGIFFVMFHTGMELNPKELLEHLWPSLAVAFGGFALPFILGFLTTHAFGGTLMQSLFVGMGVSVTAIAVQAVILYSMRINQSEIGRIIMGAAIADDILSLIALSALIGLAKSGSLQWGEIGWILVRVVGFFGATILIGHFVMPKLVRNLTDKGAKAFTFAIASALLMAYLAELAGLHLIIGAFLAGQFVREDIMDEKIYKSLNDRFYGISYGFLVPIFFASMAFHLHLPGNVPAIAFSVCLILAAIAGKLLGCGLGARAFGFSRWESIVIGCGMNGRGAVELVVAAVVLKLSDELMRVQSIEAPLLTEAQFSALVIMAVVTTLIAPISLRWAANRTCGSEEKAQFCKLWENGKEAP